MRLLGNAARLFTTLVESADAVLLLGYGASFTLNGMLAWQIRAYAPRKEDWRASGSSILFFVVTWRLPPTPPGTVWGRNT